MLKGDLFHIALQYWNTCLGYLVNCAYFSNGVMVWVVLWHDVQLW